MKPKTNKFEILYSFWKERSSMDNSKAESFEDKLHELQSVMDVYWYDDGEDYCFETKFQIETSSECVDDILNEFEKQISTINVPGGLHYIKDENGTLVWPN